MLRFTERDWGRVRARDWTGDKSDKVDLIADAAEGYLRAGWDGSEDGKSVGSPNVGQASDETADDSLRAIGERARRRAIGWDLLAAGARLRKSCPTPSAAIRRRRSPVDASGCDGAEEAGAVVARGVHRGVA